MTCEYHFHVGCVREGGCVCTSREAGEARVAHARDHYAEALEIGQLELFRPPDLPITRPTESS